jgi:hypothetical protein
MRYPFTLVKIKSNVGTMWHARFWDESLQKYAHSRTTGILVEGKKEHRREAEEAAKKLLETFTATPSGVTITQARQGVANTPLIEYLSSFWTPTSEYTNFKQNVQKSRYPAATSK